MGTRFLESLTATQSKATLKHIKALGGSIFRRAVADCQLIMPLMLPWLAAW